MKRVQTAIGLIAIMLVGNVLAQNNPFIGRWKLNIAKSKFSPGPPPQSRTEVLTAAGDGVTNTADGIDGKGTRLAFTYTYQYDGKDYPITGNGPNEADTIAARRIDANIVELSFKKAGRVVQTTRRTIDTEASLPARRGRSRLR